MRTERKNRWERDGKRGEETGQGGCQRGITDMKLDRWGNESRLGMYTPNKYEATSSDSRNVSNECTPRTDRGLLDGNVRGDAGIHMDGIGMFYHRHRRRGRLQGAT